MNNRHPSSPRRCISITGFCGPVAAHVLQVITQPRKQKTVKMLLDLSYQQWDFHKRIIPELWLRLSVGTEQSEQTDKLILESLPWTGLQRIPLPTGALAMIGHDSLPLAAQWARHMMLHPTDQPAYLLWHAMAIRFAWGRLSWQEPKALVLIHVHTLDPRRQRPVVMKTQFA